MNIFECKDEMPQKDNSPDVVRVALGAPEMLKNHMHTLAPNKDASVENVIRPRRGHDY